MTKKNKAPLTKLKDWLIEQGHGATITSPLLLIDDEADNASINTAKNPGATTAINAVIREILNLFERSTYIGYTATPFANIFIDPDTSDAMLRDDLFRSTSSRPWTRHRPTSEPLACSPTTVIYGRPWSRRSMITGRCCRSATRAMTR